MQLTSILESRSRNELPQSQDLIRAKSTFASSCWEITCPRLIFMPTFWPKISFFHRTKTKISKTLIKLHEHESDQFYRSIIRSAFNTHTRRRRDWCGEEEGKKNKWLQCVFRPKTRRFSFGVYVGINFFYDISTIWDHYEEKLKATNIDIFECM